MPVRASKAGKRVLSSLSKCARGRHDALAEVFRRAGLFEGVAERVLDGGEDIVAATVIVTHEIADTGHDDSCW